MARPSTIQIFLPDGSARSIKIAEISNRIVQAILIPRSKLEDAGKRLEIRNVGIYFLFGHDEDKTKPIAYIGEAEDCYNRLKQHNQKKDFWSHAIVVVTKTSSFTKSHVKYLEHYCVEQANKIGRYEMDNVSTPTKSHITEQMLADVMDIFDTMKILFSTLGYPIFEEIRQKQSKKDLLYCKGKDASAIGEFTDEGLVVLRGSRCNLKESKTAGNWIINMRKKLIDNKILIQKDNILEFTADYIFNSPSAAAGSILARRANGWLEWKNNDGKTLDELKRK